METWPEFVTEEQSRETPPRRASLAAMTGWESVVFELGDEDDVRPERPEKIG